MTISVLTTNVFGGQDHLKIAAANLAAQTCQDFEWVLADAYYEDNKALVAALAEARGLRHVVHVPFCPAAHVGRMFHWEGYNNALMLASHDVFLRVGMFRYIHHGLVALAADRGSRGQWVSMRQRDADDVTPDSDYPAVAERHGLELNTVIHWDQMVSHCGMFSFDRRKLLAMNGNNEALVIHHWEDIDLNCRWSHLGPVQLLSIENGMLRLRHGKDNPFLAKRPCPAGTPCIVHAKNSHELERYASPETEWFEYRGFPWARCRACRAVAVGFCDKYFDFLKTNPLGFRAPVGVGGDLGRNLQPLYADLRKLTSLSSKCELLAASHTDPRYLRE